MTSPISPPALANPVVEPTSAELTYLELLQRLEENAKALASRLDIDWIETMEKRLDQHSAAKQALTVARLGLFDESFYLATYSDVRAAGFEPIVHYVNLGDREGRRPNAYFDPTFYRDQFSAQPVHSVSALYHYAVLGEAIGLRASGAFAPRRYLVANSSLQGWLDRPLTHFLHLGRQAGLMANRRTRLSGNEKISFQKAGLPKATKPVDLGLGVNLVGPLDRVSGLGVSTRGYLDGLRIAGIEKVGSRPQKREFSIQKSIAGLSAFPPWIQGAQVNLVHMNGDTLPIMLQDGGDEFLRDKYNVAVWYWELPTLRPEWQASMKHFHEFWAPTPFIARAISQSTAKPVRLVPPYLAYLAKLRRASSDSSGQPHFVYCFDANSIIERKNPGALLDAFLKAFPTSSRARLTFKVTYPNRKIPEVERLYQAAAKDPRIQIIDRMMSDADLHALIGSASAYVSPHRSEGLGLTVIEAMGAGVPVISTPFGGVDAFVTTETAFPIAIRRIELEADYIPYPQGFVWADPDVDSLAAQLLLVHTDKDEATRRANIARQRVLDYFCSQAVLERYRDELTRISSLCALASQLV